MTHSSNNQSRINFLSSLLNNFCANQLVKLAGQQNGTCNSLNGGEREMPEDHLLLRLRDATIHVHKWRRGQWIAQLPHGMIPKGRPMQLLSKQQRINERAEDNRGGRKTGTE